MTPPSIQHIRLEWEACRTMMHAALNFERGLSAHQRRALDTFCMSSSYYRALSDRLEESLRHHGWWDDPTWDAPTVLS